jgi:AcrR family transcriptional regulator
MATRTLLRDTAIAQLTERGYDAFSLVELAQSCNLTRGAVYHHFANKEALFLEVVQTLLAAMGQTIELWATRGQGRPFDALLWGTRGFLEATQLPAYQRIILTDAPAVLGVATWQQLDDEYTTSTLVEVFRELHTPGAPWEPEVLAQAFSGALNQLSRWVKTPDDVDRAYRQVEWMARGLFVASVEASLTTPASRPRR